MPNFTIAFDGLIALVFNRPLKQTPAPDGVTVLIPNLLASRQLQNVTINGADDILDPHYPLLRFATAPDPASTWPAGMTLPAPGGPVSACLLYDMDLALEIDGKAPAGAVQIRNSAAASEQDLDTLWWLATIEDAFPNQYEAVPALVIDRPLAFNQVVARLALAQGKLTTGKLSDYPCQFTAPSTSTFKQKIALNIQYTIPFQQQVALVSTAWKPDPAGTVSRIVWKSAADLVVQIGNVEADPFFGLPIDQYPANRPLEDFEVFYGLVQPANVKGKMGGIASPVQLLPNGSAAGHTMCPPGGMH
jgi:hypothetical protein